MPTLFTADQTAQFAALCELVYVRGAADLPLQLSEIDSNLSYVRTEDLPPGAQDSLSTTGIYRSGDFYYSDRGFCGTIVKSGTNYTVVLRGTDVGPINSAVIGTAFATGYTSDGVDAYDINHNYFMGAGVTFQTQLNDAIALAEAAIAASGGHPENVVVVGQSLGGGLAGLVSAYLNL